MDKIGYISVLFGQENLLQDYFKSIALQSCPVYGIYLIDNSPSAEMMTMVQAMKDRYPLLDIKYVQNTRNLGAAKANNKGIQMAIEDGCTACILSNTDIAYDDPNLFCEVARLSAEKNGAIVAPKIYYFGTHKIWYAGGDMVKWKGGVVHYHDRKEENKATETSCFTGYAPTTFLYIPIKTFEEAGLLDEQYFLYMEDAEWVHRAGVAGYKIWYAANIHLFHKVSITTGGILSDLGIYYNTRNRLFFIRQYFSFFQKLLAACYIMGSTAYFVLRTWRFSAWRAYFKAIYDGLFTTLKLPHL
ncbi:MAG: glycosyltransferase family 2 protein [Bacteroidetes bacterium]|nr:glycosyltransferase family 2 protein [Bacteroidota bacterium]